MKGGEEEGVRVRIMAGGDAGEGWEEEGSSKEDGFGR